MCVGVGVSFSPTQPPTELCTVEAKLNTMVPQAHVKHSIFAAICHLKGILQRTACGKAMTSYNECDGGGKSLCVCECAFVCADSKERTRVDHSLPSGPHRCLLHTLIIPHLSHRCPCWVNWQLSDWRSTIVT